MTKIVPFNRVIPVDAADALRIAVLAVAATYTGYISNLGVYALTFDDTATDNDINAGLQVALNFDMNTRTAAQQTQAAHKSDYLDLMMNKALAAITAIESELTAIDNDRTALAAAGTLAAVKPLVDNMLVRQKANEQRLEAIIKALLHLGDVVT